MNVKIIAQAVGTVVAKIAKIGATQTAIQNLQNTNRKDINEFNSGNYETNLKLVTKEDVKNHLAKGKGNRKEELVEGLKNVGKGSVKVMKIGAQTQAMYSLNEMNRDEMKNLDGQMKRGYKYNVSPKLKNIKMIKVGRD